ncbi:MAG TPA: hypothetical protein VF623_11365 [Segetibacter sp.]|jgi:hypothetical protein
MNNPSYSLEILEIVINNCNFEELVTVSVSLKNEIDAYEISEIKQLFKLIKNRYSKIKSLCKPDEASSLKYYC